MARLTKLTKDQVTAEVREKFEQIGAVRGNVPNMFRVYAHRPEILKTMMAHMDAVTNSGHGAGADEGAGGDARLAHQQLRVLKPLAHRAGCAARSDGRRRWTRCSISRTDRSTSGEGGAGVRAAAHDRCESGRRRAVRAAAAALRRRRDRGDLRDGRIVQLLQPRERRAADGTDETGRGAVKRLTFLRCCCSRGVAKPPAAMPVTPVPFPFGHSTSTPYVVADGRRLRRVVGRRGRTFEFRSFRRREMVEGELGSLTATCSRTEPTIRRSRSPAATSFAQWREKAGRGGASAVAVERRRRDVEQAGDAASGDGSRVRIRVDAAARGRHGADRLARRTRERNGSCARRRCRRRGTLSGEVVVDARVCDCCQTAMAMTPRGPLVVYRDRSAKEMRDIAIARAGRECAQRAGSQRRLASTGCPVNGPRIVAHGSDAVVAWYTRREWQAGRCSWRFRATAARRSALRSASMPGIAGGRVDVVLLGDGGSAIVTWAERAGVSSHVMARRVAAAGNLGLPITIGKGMSSDFRASLDRRTRSSPPGTVTTEFNSQ